VRGARRAVTIDIFQYIKSHTLINRPASLMTDDDMRSLCHTILVYVAVLHIMPWLEALHCLHHG
jgi:hypothetical protein